MINIPMKMLYDTPCASYKGFPVYIALIKLYGVCGSVIVALLRRSVTQKFESI